MSRVAFAQAGLPTPQLQVNLGDAEGFIGRVDFLWPGQRVIGEADGLGKYKDIWTNGAGTAERVRAALHRGLGLAGR